MKILVVEDSRRLRESLTSGLRRLGYAVDAACDGEEGYRLASLHNYDVMLLDLMLPRLDGLSALRKLRAAGNQTHILILTAKDSVPDRVTGLEAGADDYLTKPFAFDELVARIQALGRRKYGNKSSQIILGNLTLESTERRVTRGGHEEIVLTGREYALLELFALRLGHIVTRQQIEEAIYDGRMENPVSNTVDSAVCVLRKKIDQPGQPSMIQTRRGLGYVMLLPDTQE